MIRTFLVFLAFIIWQPSVLAGQEQDPKEHFTRGEFRGSLFWDNISAMELGILKFGGSAGIHVLNGIEVGYQQQFIVPTADMTQIQSWGYVRLVPFRDWVVNPFLATRVGHYFLPEKDAPAVGAGCGAVFFVDRHLAFEASVFAQIVLHPAKSAERQTEFNWGLVLFF